MDINEGNQIPPENSASNEPRPQETAKVVVPLDLLGPPPAPKKKKSHFWRVVVGILLGLSIIGNVILLVAVLGMAVAFAAGRGNYDGVRYREDVVQSGPWNRKIAVITLDGLIDDKMSERIVQQVDRARSDRNVKAVILEINSPGGGVAASDRINKEIRKLAKEDGIPAVAYMKDVAASGGYYSAVGCDTIIAEPTTITGSIGVIMSTFVVQQLLEDKLGIQSVVITAGSKKDWPSMFKPVTEEQRAYLQERLIQPAYKRFVEAVKTGRPNLTERQVLELADGSIYTGDAALGVGLVDQVGYFQDAVDTAMKLANVQRAEVVRYKEPVKLMEALMGAESKATFKLDRSMLYELSTPQLMYLWAY